MNHDDNEYSEIWHAAEGSKCTKVDHDRGYVITWNGNTTFHIYALDGLCIGMWMNGAHDKLTPDQAEMEIDAAIEFGSYLEYVL